MLSLVVESEISSSCLFLRLYRLVYIGPGQKPRRQFSQDVFSTFSAFGICDEDILPRGKLQADP